MTAELVMTQDEVDADRDRWKQVRRGGDGDWHLTASDMAAVAGLAPPEHSSPFALYHAKLEGFEIGDRAAMIRGRHLEPVVADMFTDAHPWWTLGPAGLYRNSDLPWQMATYDRWGWDRQAAAQLGDGLAPVPVQIKTWHSRESANPLMRWGEPGTDQIPVHIRAQCLTEMDVDAAAEVLIPVLFMDRWQVETYVLRRDGHAAQRDIDLLRELGEAFRNRLDRRDPPDPDWTPATTETLRKLHPDLVDEAVDVGRGLARRYHLARARQRDADRRLDEIKNLLRARMGNAAYAVALDDDHRPVKVCSRSITDTPVKAHTRHVDKLTPGRWGRQ